MTAQIIALTRAVSDTINNCELTHITRESIDVDLARQQHHQYEKILASLGCQVVSLPEEPNHPDAVFIEDMAIVLDEIAILTRPGVVSRRAETPSVAIALKQYRNIAEIETLEGGDVLCLGRCIYVGLSDRSNLAGIQQLRTITAPYGYAVYPVPLTGCLHLKSAVTQVERDAVLLNPAWIEPQVFEAFHILEIDHSELYAANVLLIGTTALYPTSYPRTMRRLEGLGINVIPVDVSELTKAEGAVTCCSILFNREVH